MATKRLTSADYRQEYKEVQQSLTAINNRITNRLLTLCKENPNVPLYKRPKFLMDTEIVTVYSSQINNKRIIEGYDTLTQLELIETIEKFLAQKEPYVQGKLFNQ